MSITYYQGDLVINREFGLSAYTPVTYYYVGLATGVDINGVITGEPSGGSYARVQITNNKTTFTTSSGVASLSNAIKIGFPECTAALGWGTMSYMFISDAATSGNVLYFQPLTTNRTVQLNATVYFDIGGLVASITN